MTGDQVLFFVCRELVPYTTLRYAIYEDSVRPTWVGGFCSKYTSNSTCVTNAEVSNREMLGVEHFGYQFPLLGVAVSRGALFGPPS